MTTEPGTRMWAPMMIDSDFSRLSTAFGRSRHLAQRIAAQRRLRRTVAKVSQIVADTRPSMYYDSESTFAKLQDAPLPVPEYGYDSYSAWRRASERTLSVLRVLELQHPGKRVLEIAAGDGMTGQVLSTYGHDVTLCDIEDWRDDRAKSLPFVACDVCDSVPLDDSSFDLIVSFNAFEHFIDPLSAFLEVKRLCRANGIIVLSFDPLYCSPWGLHAYRALRMPYPQFLFSRPFIDRKIEHLGIHDLGKKMYTLQPLNEWRIDQFEGLWHNDSFKIMEEQVGENWTQLETVVQYANAFRGRNLTVRDLVAHGINVILRKLK